MAVPKRRWSKQRTRTLHANWKLQAPALVECPQCHQLMASHRVCKSCGFYKGKEVLAVKEA